MRTPRERARYAEAKPVSTFAQPCVVMPCMLQSCYVRVIERRLNVKETGAGGNEKSKVCLFWSFFLGLNFESREREREEREREREREREPRIGSASLERLACRQARLV